MSSEPASNVVPIDAGVRLDQVCAAALKNGTGVTAVLAALRDEASLLREAARRVLEAYAARLNAAPEVHESSPPAPPVTLAVPPPAVGHRMPRSGGATTASPSRPAVNERLHPAGVRDAVPGRDGEHTRSVPPARRPRSPAAVAAAAAVAQAGLLDTHRTAIGKVLGDCTRGDLVEMGRGHARLGWFYAAIADRMGEGVVRATWSDRDVAELWIVSKHANPERRR